MFLASHIYKYFKYSLFLIYTSISKVHCFSYIQVFQMFIVLIYPSISNVLRFSYIEVFQLFNVSYI